VTDNLSIYS